MHLPTFWVPWREQVTCTGLNVPGDAISVGAISLLSQANWGPLRGYRQYCRVSLLGRQGLVGAAGVGWGGWGCLGSITRGVSASLPLGSTLYRGNSFSAFALSSNVGAP